MKGVLNSLIYLVLSKGVLNSLTYVFYHKECIVLPARKGEISSWAPAKALKCRYLLKLNRIKESKKVNESESKVSELSGNQ